MRLELPLFLTLLFLSYSDTAKAELSLALYSGFSQSYSSDLDVWQKDKLSLTLHDVSWNSSPIRSPYYWGFRMIYWKNRLPSSGIGLDFTRTKISASNDQIVKVSGNRNSDPVHGNETVGQSVRNLSLNGLHFLMVNLYYRWQPQEKFRPYAGVGAGIALPNVEGSIGSSSAHEVHYGGTALQGLGGFELSLSAPFSLFSEYKIHHAWIRAPLDPSTNISTSLWTHQFLLGFSAAIEMSGP